MASGLRVEDLTVTLNETQRAGIARGPAKDAAAIEKVTKNYDDLSVADKKLANRLFFSYYKTLAPKVDDVDKIIDDNEKKGGAERKGSAPIKDQRAVAPEWKRILGHLMNGVDKQFQNWAILARGMEKDLSKQSKDLAFFGVTDNKRVVKKGAFVFFLTDNEMKLWFSTMVQIGGSLMNWVLGGNGLNLKIKQNIPTNKDGWLAIIKDNLTDDKIVPAPSLDDVRKFFNDAMKEVLTKDKLSDDTKSKFELQLEVFSLVRPSRLLLTRDSVTRGKTIPRKLAQGIMAGYANLAKIVKDVFNIKTVDVQIRDQKTMNQSAAEIVAIYNNLIPQFRAVRRGGEKARLGANESRVIEEFDFKF